MVAISLMVLIGAGLFPAHACRTCETSTLGFNIQNLVVFSVNPRLNGYDAVRVSKPLRSVAAKLGLAIPGVRSVSHSGNALLSGGSSTTSMFIQGKPESAGA